MNSYDEAVIQQEVAVIGTLARGLNEFLNGLSPNDLRRHSACDAWTVRDGRLYLNWNASVRERWLGSNVANGIRVGERNWELVVKDILEGDAEYSRKSDSPWNAL